MDQWLLACQQRDQQPKTEKNHSVKDARRASHSIGGVKKRTHNAGLRIYGLAFACRGLDGDEARNMLPDRRCLM